MFHRKTYIETAHSLEGSRIYPLTFLPVTTILFPEEPVSAIRKEVLLFCYKVAVRSLKACLSNQYIDLDAMTTTTCCHGMALFFRSLLLETEKKDFVEYLREGETRINFLEIAHNVREFKCTWYLSQPLIELARLYILSQIKETDPIRRWKSAVTKLKEIVPIGTKLCTKMVADLQTYFSNKIADSYYTYLQDLNEEMNISGAPARMWGKYVHPKYIRSDRRGRKYAPCLFSMQVSLTHLIQTQSMVALVNDLRWSKGEIKGRYVQLLRGDGMAHFVPISASEIMKNGDEGTPVIVFGGCAYSDTLTVDSFQFLIDPWLSRFSQLILACDVKYPQFPAVRDDPNFDSTPIIPEEEHLQKTIEFHRRIPGVCAKDPSFFCLTHIYTASLKEVLSVSSKEREDALPYSFLSEVARSTHL